MTFVEFETETGKSHGTRCYVNPAYVSVVQQGVTFTQIVLVDGSRVNVKGAATDVMMCLAKAAEEPGISFRDPEDERSPGSKGPF